MVIRSLIRIHIPIPIRNLFRTHTRTRILDPNHTLDQVLSPPMLLLLCSEINRRLQL